jgi:RNA polymerase sigma factor (sigma-70 family)
LSSWRISEIIDVTFTHLPGTIRMMKTLLPMIRRLAHLSPAEVVEDRVLLRRFVQQRDQAAFELLVHRHGPMVLGLCRKLIGNVHDAEDAFQATFLTLAQRARGISRGRSLGSWLYKVGLRMCQRLRRRRDRWLIRTVSEYANRGTHGSQALAGEPPVAPGQSHPEALAQRREEALLLAHEVDRLSETLRSVVILCYWQGKSSIEAARELGCPANTVSIRLRRARERLKDRLSRRGIVLSAGIAATLGASSASAQVSPVLAATLAGTAVRLVQGALGAGMITQSVTLLMKGALVTMWWKPVKLCCLALVAVGVVSVPVWQGMSPAAGQPPAPYSSGPTITSAGAVSAPVDVWYQQPSASGYTPVQTYSADGRVHYTYAPNPSPFEEWIEGTYGHDENLPEDAKKLIADQQAKEEALRKELEKQLKSQRTELYAKLRQMQDSYTKAGDLDHAVAVRDQARRLEFFIADAKPDPGSLSAYRAQVGKSFVFSVVGKRMGAVWGDDGVYTDDSDLGTAAVHAGVLRVGQRGLVKVTMLEGKGSYGGSSQHGITSHSYGSFPGSYRVERAPSPTSGTTTSTGNAEPFGLDKTGVERSEVFRTKTSSAEGAKAAPGYSYSGGYPNGAASKTAKPDKSSSTFSRTVPVEPPQSAPAKLPAAGGQPKGPENNNPLDLPK